MRNLELPGRSTAHGLNGMAATSQALATLTALNVLQAGGNAMDAAVAACAVQCVVEPGSTGIGGDCFVLYAPGGGSDIIAYNGSGRAPLAAMPEWFAEQGIAAIEQTAPHAVTVPGAVDAWDRLIGDHGSKDLGELLQPAITFARDGYAISPRVGVDWEAAVDLLNNDANAAAVFLPEGRPLRVGEVHHQPALAATLDKIAAEGRDAFYKGPVAEDMVEYLQGLGGLHTLDDFAGAAGQYVSPIKTEFRGYQVHECPPNGQGIIALLLLNVLKGFDPDDAGPLSVERLHLEIEATKLAYAARDAYVADPDKAEVDADAILSDAYADAVRARIDLERANDDIEALDLPRHENTVYISVVDKDRNACSFINSVYHSFGSGRVAPKSGVLLQNRGEAFVVDSGHPNCIGPGKRPMHTIIPAMLTKGDRAQMSFGVMGGNYQAHGHAHFLSRVIDYGFDVQEAIDLPRLFPDPEHDGLDMESGFSEDIVEGLKKLGHRPIPPGKPLGGAQAIWIDWDNGALIGGSEPRKDGCALGY